MVVVGGDVSTEGGTKEGAVITDERDGGVWVGMKLEKAPSVGVSAPSVGVSAPSVGVSAPSGGVSRRRRRAHTPRREAGGPYTEDTEATGREGTSVGVSQSNGGGVKQWRL